MSSALDRWRQWSRERELAGPSRAGLYARRRARERQLKFVKRHARPLILFLVALALLVVPFQFVLHDQRARWAFNGAYLTAIVAIAVYEVLVLSGSASILMGDMGEQWTRDELRSLSKHDWRVIHHLRLRGYGDIDTVLLGPAGLVVIETKWSSEPWSVASRRRRIAEAAPSVARSAVTVKNVVRKRTGEIPARAAVVLWPSEGQEAQDQQAVAILPGNTVAAWVRALPSVGLTREAIADGWRELEAHVRRRDEYDFETEGPPPTTADAYMWRFLQLIAGFVCATWITITAFALGHPFKTTADWVESTIGVAVAGATIFGLRRLGVSRRFFDAAATAWAGVVAFIVAGVCVVLFKTYVI